MEKLEKQLEFEFMKEERKQEKRFEKYMGSVPEMLTAVTSVAWLSYLILYSYYPKVIDSFQDYIKHLIH